MMGNRGGRFHKRDRTLGKRRHVSRRWICCVCDFKGRQRQVWGDGYTEVFFLDEVTALAAGHRPCFECRRADAQTFATLFPVADGKPTSADAMDVILHAERLTGWRGDRITLQASDLPDGAMFTSNGNAFAVKNRKALQWDFSGYCDPVKLEISGVEVLTPASTLAVLAKGYEPRWHATAA
jgi:hypothetical protein